MVGGGNIMLLDRAIDYGRPLIKNLLRVGGVSRRNVLCCSQAGLVVAFYVMSLSGGRHLWMRHLLLRVWGFKVDLLVRQYFSRLMNDVEK